LPSLDVEADVLDSDWMRLSVRRPKSQPYPDRTDQRPCHFAQIDAAIERGTGYAIRLHLAGARRVGGAPRLLSVLFYCRDMAGMLATDSP
jgi:hypothetical protein